MTDYGDGEVDGNGDAWLPSAPVVVEFCASLRAPNKGSGITVALRTVAVAFAVAVAVVRWRS